MTLLVLDSASLWYRAYYGMPNTLLSPSGEPVNAVRGYFDMVSRLILQYKPNRVIAAIEGDWRPSWRVKLFAEYKANRVDDEGGEEEPDLLTPQIPIILEGLDALGIPVIGVDDFEADDIMATLSKSEPGPIRLATGDRDLFQLIDKKKDVKVIYLAKGIANHDLVDENWVEKKYGIPGERYALFAMIRGDASDGLPGIKGIGEKGAAEIANNFANLNAVLDAVTNGDSKLKDSHRKKISESIEYANIMEKLVMCATDVRMPIFQSQISKFKPNLGLINDLITQYGLQTSMARMKDALGY